MTKILLIDGDMLAYRACAAAEYEAEFDGTLIKMSNKDAVVGYIENMLSDIGGDLDVSMDGSPDTARIALSCPADACWRLDVLPTYKSNRGSGKPMGYGYARDYLASEYWVVAEPRLEADDLLGIWATSLPEETVIVSIDKDMKTIPGWFCQWPKEKVARYYTEEDAKYYHLYQTLMGDSVDGYPGCPGVGPKTAEKILAPFAGRLDDAWETILQVYEMAFAKKKLGGVADAHMAANQNAQVAKILWASEYDQATGEVTLWSAEKQPQPPTSQPPPFSCSEESQSTTSSPSEASGLMECGVSQASAPTED